MYIYIYIHIHVTYIHIIIPSFEGMSLAYLRG